MFVSSCASLVKGLVSASNTAEGESVATPPTRLSADSASDQLKRRLKAASQGLGLACLQLRSGQTEDAEATIVKLRNGFQLWSKRLEGQGKRAVPKTFPRQRAKVLLVEDEPNQRELLAGFLRLAGMDVDTAGDGLDALDHLHARGRPDMVLLDMGLPRCDGPTTVREIRRDPTFAGLKIVAVTGHPPSDFGFDDNPTGIDRWIRKPIDPQALIEELGQELCSPSCCV